MATPTLNQMTHNQIQTIPPAGLNTVLAAPASAGDALIALVIGQKPLAPYSNRTDSNPYNNINNTVPAPVVQDNEGNTWSAVSTFQMVDLLSATPTPYPTYPTSTQTPESVPDLDAVFPSVYLTAALNVAAGTQSLNTRAVYLPLDNIWNNYTAYAVGDAVTITSKSGTWPFQQLYTTYVCVKSHTNHQPPNGTYWSLVASPSTDPRFAGGPGQNVYKGLDILLMDWSGIATSAAVDGVAVAGKSTANPATAGAITTTSSGDLLLAIGLQKDSNQFSPPAGYNSWSPAVPYSKTPVYDGAPIIQPAAPPTPIANYPNWTIIHKGKLIGSEEHFVVMASIQPSAGAVTPGFVNPQKRVAGGSPSLFGGTTGDYGPTTAAALETVVMAAALKHS